MKLKRLVSALAVTFNCKFLITPKFVEPSRSYRFSSLRSGSIFPPFSFGSAFCSPVTALANGVPLLKDIDYSAVEDRIIFRHPPNGTLTISTWARKP